MKKNVILETSTSSIAQDVPLLEVKNLTLHYVTNEGTVCAVNDISLTLEKGETLGLVGETGAGKTSTALGIMGLVPNPPGKIISGSISLAGENLREKNEAFMRKVRGGRISMIFQDPMTALNPIDKVGDQIAEVIELHNKCSKAEAAKNAAKMLELVGIPGERYHEYPYQFSGGMKQRIVIAIALACNPEILIADEPTTALDVTIQAQVLEMMDGLKQKFQTAMLMITHDLGIIAETCDRVAIIYAGEIVELGNLEHIFDQTAHPYTVGLFNSLPSTAEGEQGRLSPIPGLMPDPTDLPDGCKFSPRCIYADEICKTQSRTLEQIDDTGHFCRCWKWKQLKMERRK